MIDNILSDCCYVDVKIEGSRSTHYYVCTKCECPCDVINDYLDLKTRVKLYSRRFHKFPPLQIVDALDGIQRIEFLWIMGNTYSVQSNYYGGYPHGYLDRVGVLFPEMKDILHLFSGALPKGNYVRFDLKDADVCGDAHRLSTYFPAEKFDLIFADPPYSNEDAEHYGTPMVRRVTVLKECWKILKIGGWVVWLDQVLPMWSKRFWYWQMAGGMIKSTNHRVRGVFGFVKHEENKKEKE